MHLLKNKLLIDEIEPYGGEKVWSLTKGGLKTKSFSNPFWQNILEIWSNTCIQQNTATTPEEILSQPIWYNKNIKIANKSVFFKQWCSRGIYYINDFMKEDGTFLSLQELMKHIN